MTHNRIPALYFCNDTILSYSLHYKMLFVFLQSVSYVTFYAKLNNILALSPHKEDLLVHPTERNKIKLIDEPPIMSYKIRIMSRNMSTSP